MRFRQDSSEQTLPLITATCSVTTARTVVDEASASRGILEVDVARTSASLPSVPPPSQRSLLTFAVTYRADTQDPASVDSFCGVVRVCNGAEGPPNFSLSSLPSLESGHGCERYEALGLQQSRTRTMRVKPATEERKREKRKLGQAAPPPPPSLLTALTPPPPRRPPPRCPTTTSRPRPCSCRPSRG